MIRQDEVGVDTQTHTETITMDSDTGDLAEVLKRLDAQMEVATEDGYTGTSSNRSTTGYTVTAKARLWPLRNVYTLCTLTLPTFLPETCAECGTFTVLMRIPQREWRRP